MYAYKYKQVCDTRLLRRRDQSGTAQAGHIKGLRDVSVFPAERQAMHTPLDRSGLGPRGLTGSTRVWCKMKTQQMAEGFRYRMTPGSSLI